MRRKNLFNFGFSAQTGLSIITKKWRGFRQLLFTCSRSHSIESALLMLNSHWSGSRLIWTYDAVWNQRLGLLFSDTDPPNMSVTIYVAAVPASVRTFSATKFNRLSFLKTGGQQQDSTAPVRSKWFQTVQYWTISEKNDFIYPRTFRQCSDF